LEEGRRCGGSGWFEKLEAGRKMHRKQVF